MKGDTYFNTCAELQVQIVFADLHGLHCPFPQWAVFSAIVSETQPQGLAVYSGVALRDSAGVMD